MKIFRNENNRHMKILCVSDTHNKHLQIPIKFLENTDNSIETIIHAGDISGRGWKKEVEDFLKWYDSLNFKFKVFIPGNHDFFYEKSSNEEISELHSKYPSIIYLNNTGTEINGVKIWGSGMTPFFYNWAFNCRGEEIKQYWDMIPLDIDILITHGAVRGYLDRTIEGNHTGCPYLLEHINKMSNLKYHICGHIHEAYGRFLSENGCEFINASVLYRDYVMSNAPIKIII